MDTTPPTALPGREPAVPGSQNLRLLVDMGPGNTVANRASVEAGPQPKWSVNITKSPKEESFRIDVLQ